jgi:hypothetical protein
MDVLNLVGEASILFGYADAALRRVFPSHICLRRIFALRRDASRHIWVLPEPDLKPGNIRPAKVSSASIFNLLDDRTLLKSWFTSSSSGILAPLSLHQSAMDGKPSP